MKIPFPLYFGRLKSKIGFIDLSESLCLAIFCVSRPRCAGGTAFAIFKEGLLDVSDWNTLNFW